MDIPFVVKSPLSFTLFETAKQLSTFPTTVLIEGEIGVGKEVVAEMIHRWSPRANKPFVKVSCGSIPDLAHESELIGADRGLFSARTKDLSLFETANQGTLFLDEVGDLSLPGQVKLLGFLHDRERMKAGGSWSKQTDIRILASSSTPLADLVKEKKFREDLYYRLHVGHLIVPALRERPEEIVPLLEYYLDHFCQAYNLKKEFKNTTLDRLKSYRFPGNVRELRNLVERLSVTTAGQWILPENLPEYIYAKPLSVHSLEAQVGEFESRLIKQALEIEGSIRKAAARLQVSHATLLRRMQKLEIEK